MVDKPADGTTLQSAWRSLGQRIAVAGGALVAILGLLYDVPTTTAALRGAGTWLALLAAVRFGAWALACAQDLDQRAGLGKLIAADAETPEEAQVAE